MLLATSDEHDSRVRKEAASLAATGYRVRVISPAAEGRQASEAVDGVEYHRVPFGRPVRDAWRRRRARQVAQRERRTFAVRAATAAPYRARVRFETFAYKRGNVVARHVEVWRSLRPALEAYQPEIVHAHDLNTVYAGMRYARRHRVPFIYDAHELELGSRRRRQPYERLITRIVERRAVRAAARVITVGSAIADELARTYRVRRPAVILNSPSLRTRGLDPPLSLRAACGAATGDIVVVYTGLLLGQRGLVETAAALPLLPARVHFAILGPRKPEPEAELLAQAAVLGVRDRVHLVDPVPGTLVPAVVATADMAIIPLPGLFRSYALAQPNKLFEAVMAGVPIITSSATGIASFVREHELGAVFDLGDPASIARAVQEVDAHVPAGIADRERLGRLQEAVAWERQEEILRDVYKEVTGC
jgi:glycosyltransferase involved in cell wall biosynthesis